jgi:dTDP-N-acetylfucosamine:lipid II N-acetylfucosaminyltransferase
LKRILHIAIDDKFIESANWQFEQIFPGSNKFYIIIYNSDSPLKFVKMHSNYELLIANDKSLDKVLNEIINYDLVVFHGLDDFRCEIVLRSKQKLKILWSFWGYEVYNYHKYFFNSIYGSETKRNFIVKKPQTLKKSLFEFYTGIEKAYKNIRRFKAISRIGYFGFPYIEEYTLLTGLKLLNSNYIRFTYYPLEFIFNDHENKYISGENILLGNSATLSNNHIEIFETLNKLDLNGKKVMVPLSYGDNNYRDKILSYGNSKIPDHFLPLTDFYSLEEYNKIIQTCNVFIMNSYRQQGIGNIFAMLWMGAKVYLDERNTCYQYLKRINCSVYSIDKDFNPHNKDIFTALNSYEVNRNREILKNELGKDHLLYNLKKQIETIFLD